MRRFVLLLFVLAGPVGAQTYSAPNLAEFQTALDRANQATVSSNIAASVPGYSGPANDLQGRAGEDVSTLQSAGGEAAASSPIRPAIAGSSAYVAAHPVDANAAWVIGALGVANDPTEASGTAGTASSSCSAAVTTNAQTTLYTCEAGNEITSESEACDTFEDIVSQPGTRTCRTDGYYDNEAAFNDIGAYTEAHRCELYAGPAGLNGSMGCGVMINKIGTGECAPPRATSQAQIYVEYCKVPFTSVQGIAYLGKRNDGCSSERVDSACTRTGSVCNSWLDEASGLCGDETVTYTCGNASYVDRGLNTDACAAYAGNWACTAGASTCLEHASDVPDIMATLSLAPDTCLKTSVSYTCDHVASIGDDCEVPSGCTLKARNCIDPNYDGTQACQTFDNVYACQTAVVPQTATQGAVCDASWVNGTQVIETGDDPENDLPEALSAINALKEASASYGSSGALTIFAGQNLKCGKTVGGLSNCCKDSGLLLDNNLASCNADEQKLMSEQKAKACHYVGTYCSNKSLFGCLMKKMSYCCYGSVLARIVEEAGHAQLGLDWGDAKGPSCGGFTVAQFQQIDLTHVDFSDFYDDKLAQLSNNDPNSTVAAISASIRTLQGSGAASR